MSAGGSCKAARVEYLNLRATLRQYPNISMFAILPLCFIFIEAMFDSNIKVQLSAISHLFIGAVHSILFVRKYLRSAEIGLDYQLFGRVRKRVRLQRNDIGIPIGHAPQVRVVIEVAPVVERHLHRLRPGIFDKAEHHLGHAISAIAESPRS